MIAISLSTLGVTLSDHLWEKYFSSADAITTPFGIYYADKYNKPSQWLIDHEQCHYQRVQEIGALAFYSDYFLGGACIEELRCGASLSHLACSEYPMSVIPN